MTKAHLLVTVDGLKELIPEQVLVDITNRAETTIAEELKRKLSQSDKFNTDKLVAAMSGKISQALETKLSDAVKAMTSKWNFPEQGKKVVQELVAETIRSVTNDTTKNAAVAAAENFRAELSRDMIRFREEARKFTQDVVDAHNAELNQRIETLARTQFLAVLKEAKEAGL